jgi:hypothetical protein
VESKEFVWSVTKSKTGAGGLSTIVTPRGPALAVRPRPEAVREWAQAAGLTPSETVRLPPWHFGLTLTK